MNHLTDYQINEILDGLDDPAARRHVEACSDCRLRLNELQQVFASLENLPEIHLTRDLTPAVLAKLPQKPSIRLWSPWLAAQWGSLAGVLFWLGMQAAQFISRFNLQGLRFNVELPNADFRLLISDLIILVSDLNPPIFDLPSLSLTNYQLPFTTSTILLLGLSALLLWVVGNAVLLRGRPEVRA